ncbi:alpha-L-glutamate ligase, partial [Kitasatospora sp. NPDC059817]
MGRRELVLLTDHSSTEGSRDVLAAAARALTGRAPVLLDARHFMTGGGGRIRPDDGGGLRLEADGRSVAADAVVVYEIPPHRRRDFAPFQRLLGAHGARSLGTDVQAWRAATEKDLTVARFTRDGVAHMPTVSLSRPSLRAGGPARARGAGGGGGAAPPGGGGVTNPDTAP